MRLLAALIYLLAHLFPFFLDVPQQAQAPTGYDLIAAVNALRASHGLPPYSIDPLLMLSAQMQADYLASQSPGPVSGHIGPGGTDADARALAVGFPYVQGLDINENWASMPVGSSFTELFNGGWSDSLHQHTMLHNRGQLVGAGISVADDRMYIILDMAAYWGDAGLTPWPTSSGYGVPGSQPGVSQYIAPVEIATPRVDGKVVHRVQSGQSLWGIAIKYGVTIDSIRQLNFISKEGTIYVGQELIIKVASQETPTPILETKTPSLADFLPPKTTRHATAAQISKSNEIKSSTPIDQNAFFLLLFVVCGAGVILIFIGMRH